MSSSLPTTSSSTAAAAAAALDDDSDDDDDTLKRTAVVANLDEDSDDDDDNLLVAHTTSRRSNRKQQPPLKKTHQQLLQTAVKDAQRQATLQSKLHKVKLEEDACAPVQELLQQARDIQEAAVDRPRPVMLDEKEQEVNTWATQSLGSRRVVRRNLLPTTSEHALEYLDTQLLDMESTSTAATKTRIPTFEKDSKLPYLGQHGQLTKWLCSNLSTTSANSSSLRKVLSWLLLVASCEGIEQAHHSSIPLDLLARNSLTTIECYYEYRQQQQDELSTTENDCYIWDLHDLLWQLRAWFGMTQVDMRTLIVRRPTQEDENKENQPILPVAVASSGAGAEQPPRDATVQSARDHSATPFSSTENAIQQDDFIRGLFNFLQAWNGALSRNLVYFDKDRNHATVLPILLNLLELSLEPAFASSQSSMRQLGLSTVHQLVAHMITLLSRIPEKPPQDLVQSMVNAVGDMACNKDAWLSQSRMLGTLVDSTIRHSSSRSSQELSASMILHLSLDFMGCCWSQPWEERLEKRLTPILQECWGVETPHGLSWKSLAAAFLALTVMKDGFENIKGQECLATAEIAQRLWEMAATGNLSRRHDKPECIFQAFSDIESTLHSLGALAHPLVLGDEHFLLFHTRVTTFRQMPRLLKDAFKPQEQVQRTLDNFFSKPAASSRT